MWRVYFSRGLNVLCGGHPQQMLSARLHITQHPIRHVINTIFFWQTDHCRGSALWERRQHETEIQSDQESTS